MYSAGSITKEIAALQINSMHVGATVVALMLSMTNHATAGDGVSLTGPALLQAVAGKTVHLDTPYGAIPISYRQDGSLAGAAGKLSPYTGSANDSGKWWVTGNKLCQKWSLWLDAKTTCMSVRQDGARVEWTSSNGTTGTATIAQ
jgi:hypothetical protein